MTKITWLGHSTFTFQLATGEVIITDPWLGNPKYPKGHSLERVDYILLSHGHGDHTGDALNLAKSYKAPIIANYEIATWFGSKGAPDARGMNKGGSMQAGPVKVTMTHAIHSSSLEDGSQLIYGGEAAGFVVRFPDNRALYFAGDTAVFSDMSLIQQLYEPELCILPIGDLYTMGPQEAALACKLLKPKQVIGMHWGTFPPLTGTPQELARLVGSETNVIALEPGQSTDW